MIKKGTLSLHNKGKKTDKKKPVGSEGLCKLSYRSFFEVLLKCPKPFNKSVNPVNKKNRKIQCAKAVPKGNGLNLAI